MHRPSVKSFYEVEAQQKKKSLALFTVLLLFYITAIGIIFLAINFAIGAIFAKPHSFSVSNIVGLLGLSFVFSIAIAAFQYYDARKNGPAFILKRLSAKQPEIRDRYHRQLSDVVEEMGLAAGLTYVKPYVISDHTINSLALIEPDGTPCIALTEGMLADFTRDELEAVAAHELAHITHGDAFYLTLVCGLADFFERLSDSLSAGDEGGSSKNLAVSAVFMRLLSRFISREREILADAAAVELSRNPIALARAIYKAHVKNSFVGDFNLTYAPLFMVSPESRGEEDAGAEHWSGTHPPLMQRIRLLAEMANVNPSDVIRQVWETQMRRERAKEIEPAREEKPIVIRPSQKRFVSRGQKDQCPRCRILLSDSFYEGVSIKSCRQCTGKLVDEDSMNRILARTEIGFSESLRTKAADFRERFLLNPINILKISDRLSAPIPCPNCGYRMTSRPFNYQYFLPVEKCLSCFKIWFDTDELEILQILVEEAKAG